MHLLGLFCLVEGEYAGVTALDEAPHHPDQQDHVTQMQTLEDEQENSFGSGFLELYHYYEGEMVYNKCLT